MGEENGTSFLDRLCVGLRLLWRISSTGCRAYKTVVSGSMGFDVVMERHPLFLRPSTKFFLHHT